MDNNSTMTRSNMLHSIWIILFINVMTCAVHLCKALEDTQDNPLLISSDPPGPIFPAAAWIRFACRVDNHSDPEALHYEWRGFCNTSETAELIVNDPLLDEDRWAIIWLLSTYTTSECVDYVECHVTDQEGQEYTARRPILVAGVGIHIEQTFLGSVQNNTAILVNDNELSMIKLVCQSALRTSCGQGKWIDPNGLRVDETSIRSFQSCSEGNTTWHSYATLNIDISAISSNNSGLYTCIIQDEQKITRKMYIGVYSTLQIEAERFSSLVGLTHYIEENQVILRCTTSQLPVSSTVWSKDGRRISSSTAYTVHTTLIDEMKSMYISQLAFEWNGNNIEPVIQCDVYAEWVSPGESYYGGVYGGGKFVILTLNKPATIDCTTPQHISQVQWLNVANLNINTNPFPGLKVVAGRLNINNVTEMLHNQIFQCEGYSNNGNMRYVQHYRVIVSIPSDAFSVALTGNQSQPALEGESFSITCCYTIHTTGLLSVPTLEWYRGSGKINSEVTTEYSVISNNQCSILNILNVQKAYEDDTYTCKGILHSSLLQNGNLSVYTMLNITKAKSDSTSAATSSTSAATATSYTLGNGVLFLYLSLCMAVLNLGGQ